MTWPPPDRELEHYDVVDVRTKDEAPGRTPDDVSDGADAPASTMPPTPPDAAKPTEFSRPDWSELRLRTSGDDQQARSAWLPVVAILLALTCAGEAAYIWHLHATRRVPGNGRLRVDGPDGAEVRVSGQAIGIAPVEQEFEPGAYDVEIVGRNGQARADRVLVSIGRTVVVIALQPAAAPAAPAPSAAPPAAAPPVTVGAASGAPSAAAVPPPSATTGTVVIESTPAGQPVTMGGRPRGVTPLTLGEIRPGRHDVLVGGRMRQVDVTAGQVTTLRVP